MSPSSGTSAAGVEAALEAANRFVIQQVFKPIANEYRISAPASGSSEEGSPLLFVRQKKMRVKEDIRFRLDPERDEHLFMIKSRSVFEFAGRHEVLDPEGAAIGLLEKNFKRSLLRSHWHVYDTAGTELLEAQEQNLLIAVVRRVAGLFSDELLGLLRWLPFDFVLKRGGDEVGHYRRVLGKFRDRYVLELGPGTEGVDRRLLIAFTVALDALQDR